MERRGERGREIRGGDEVDAGMGLVYYCDKKKIPLTLNPV